MAEDNTKNYDSLIVLFNNIRDYSPEDLNVIEKRMKEKVIMKEQYGYTAVYVDSFIIIDKDRVFVTYHPERYGKLEENRFLGAYISPQDVCVFRIPNRYKNHNAAYILDQIIVTAYVDAMGY